MLFTRIAKRLGVFAIASVVCFQATAETTLARFDRSSAHRDPQTDYREILREHANPQSPLFASAPFRINSAANLVLLSPSTTPATKPLPFDLGDVPEISAADLATTFTEIRDEQLLQNPQSSQFLRRLTWLYPDDGCYARAQLATRIALKTLAARPAKLFIFGNLHVATVNAPLGAVDWWYHVAPVVKVAGQPYIIDPALHPAGALPFLDWYRLMNDANAQLRVCSPFAYNPDSPCRSGDGPDTDAVATADEGLFLSYEWERLTDLGRNPQAELGDNPPWKTPKL